MDLTILIRLLKCKDDIRKERDVLFVKEEDYFDSLVRDCMANSDSKLASIGTPSGLLMEFLDNDYYYDKIKKFFLDKECGYFYVAPINSDGKINDPYLYSKSEFVRDVEIIKDNNMLTDDGMNNFLELYNMVSFANFLRLYKDESRTYYTTDGEFDIPISRMIEFLSLSNAEIEEKLQDDFIYGIPKREFAFGLNYFINVESIGERFVLPEHFLEKEEFVSERVDFVNLDLLLEEKPVYMNYVELNKNFKERILSSVPEHFTSFQKAAYIYFRLCNCLTYDEEMIASDDFESANHANLSRLQEVDEENNEVVCYEFNAIFAKLLDYISVDYEIAGNKNYARGHTYLNFFADNFYVKADSTVGIICSDMARLKNGYSAGGLKLLHHHLLIDGEYKKQLNQVYGYLKREQINYEKSFDDAVGEYKSLINKERIGCSSDDEKIELLLDNMKNCTLSVSDRFIYFLTISSIIFPVEKNKVEKQQLLFVKDNDPENSSKKSSVATIVWYNSNGINYEEPSNNKYFVCHPSGRIEALLLEQLQGEFNNRRYEFLDSSMARVPGIESEENLSEKKVNRHSR